MAVTESDSINTCCDQWKKKFVKAQESHNTLRQAVNFLEHRINRIQAQNNKACVAKIEIGEKLEENNENNARLPLESNELCSFKSHIAARKVQQQGCGGDARDGNENEKVQGFQACIAERDEEICRLMGILETEKRKADFERKKAAEAWKLLEEEKDKSAEKEMQIARIEAEKAGEYRVRIGQLEKLVSEAKQKLTSEMSTFKAVTKRFEAEKCKILAEKRNAELGMAKANEKLVVDKHKAIEEIHDQTKNSNFMRQACNLNLSKMHSQFENELLEHCCSTMVARDPLRKNTQPTPLLALSGGNHSESITGNNCISSYCISKIDSGDL